MNAIYIIINTDNTCNAVINLQIMNVILPQPVITKHMLKKTVPVIHSTTNTNMTLIKITFNDPTHFT